MDATQRYRDAIAALTTQAVLAGVPTADLAASLAMAIATLYQADAELEFDKAQIERLAEAAIMGIHNQAARELNAETN